jgi:hypothetical protein
MTETLLVYRTFIEIRLAKVDAVMQLDDSKPESEVAIPKLLTPEVFEQRNEKCSFCLDEPENEVAIPKLLTPEVFEQRNEKCSFCLDEPDKRVAIILDDIAQRRFHVLIRRDYLNTLTPQEFLKIVMDSANALGISYTPVKPQLFLPDEPTLDIPEELMRLLTPTE